MNMSELFDLYDEHCLPDVTPRVARDYRGMFKYLRAAFGHLRPEEVKPRHVADFINVKTGRVQRNRMVMLLSAVFKKAQGRWCIEMDLDNPCKPVERWPTKPRTRYINDEEFYAFRGESPIQIQLAMDAALLTGQRQSDVTQMKWSQIHTEGPRETWSIWIDQGKTGKALAIGISEAVEAVLVRALICDERQLSSTDAVIRNKFGRAYTPDSFRALWQKFMRAWRKLHPDIPGFSFHDIRAKTVSDSENLHEASERAGHQDPSMTNRVYDRKRRYARALF